MVLNCYHTPFLFLEAEELLFHYANGLPMPEYPKEKHPFSIPAEELERMMTEACKDISWEDEVLQTFFRQYKLPQNAGGSFTCLARVLAFSFIDLPSCQSAERSVDSIIRHLISIREDGLVLEDLHPFTINTRAGTAPDGGISRLSAPAAFRQIFQQIYSDPEGTLRALVPLMKPVMAYLQQALHPWAFRAEPKLKIWEDALNTRTPQQFFTEALHYGEAPPVTHMEIGLLYFLPQRLILGLENEGKTMKIYIGAGTALLMDDPSDGLMAWEYRALQLMGSPARMRMLNAIRREAMSSRELSQTLKLHLGTVTRDINSMDEAYLLNVYQQGPRRRYSLNKQAIRTLAEHLLEMCEDE